MQVVAVILVKKKNKYKTNKKGNGVVCPIQDNKEKLIALNFMFA